MHVIRLYLITSGGWDSLRQTLKQSTRKNRSRTGSNAPFLLSPTLLCAPRNCWLINLIPLPNSTIINHTHNFCLGGLKIASEKLWAQVKKGSNSIWPGRLSWRRLNWIFNLFPLWQQKQSIRQPLELIDKWISGSRTLITWKVAVHVRWCLPLVPSTRALRGTFHQFSFICKWVDAFHSHQSWLCPSWLYHELTSNDPNLTLLYIYVFVFGRLAIFSLTTLIPFEFYYYHYVLTHSLASIQKENI